MTAINQLHNDWAQLMDRIQGSQLGWAPTPINPVAFCSSSQITTREKLLEILALTTDMEGWLVFPDEVLLWREELPRKPQPPLSGELGSAQAGLRFEYLGADTWRLMEWTLADSGEREATHVGETVVHEPAEPANKAPAYVRLWQIPGASENVALPEPTIAVFIGFRE